MNSMKPLITVCLSVYNGEKFIARAIESILMQTEKRFALFVVNDASTDSTLEIITKYTSDPRVTVVNVLQNIGTYAAKNIVLKNFAEGEWWAHHDADDWSEPGRFEKQLHYLESEMLDGCGTAIDECYEEGILPRIPGHDPLVFDPQDGLSHRLNVYPSRVSAQDLNLSNADLAKIKIAMNGSLMLRLSAVRALGGFDGMTRVAGDTDLLWRFILGWNFGNCPLTLYHRSFHRQSLTQHPATGFDSDYRKSYVVAAEKRCKRLIELRALGKIAQAEQEAAYAFFYPDVDFSVISGT